jgi:guanylate kinase
MEFSKEPGSYDHIVLNDKLDVAYKDLKEILCKVRVSCFRERLFFSFVVGY